MARYYFHVRDRDGVVQDEEGSELPGMEEARFEARMSARDFLVQDILENRRDESRVIEIADDSGTVLDRVALRDVMLDTMAPDDDEAS